MRDVPARIAWAVATLAPRSGDHLLEVGCGSGVAIALICDRLTRGTITGIDRSTIMVERARRRNVARIAAGTARIERATIESADFGGSRFDTVFAINVNAFWTEPPPALDGVRRALASNGRLYLFYEPPGASAVPDLLRKLRHALGENGFELDGAVSATAGASPCLCIRAQPGPRTTSRVRHRRP